MTLPAAYFDGDGDSNRLDQPSDHHDKHASWQTDASGNVTGLVGPDGNQISLGKKTVSGGAIFIGTSISNFAFTDDYLYGGSGWITSMNIALKWPFDTLIDAAVSGQNTSDMLLNWETRVSPYYADFETAFIEVGPNDANGPTVASATTVANLQTMIERLTQLNKLVVVLTPTPSTSHTLAAELDHMSAVTAWVLDYSSTHENVIAVEAGRVFSDPDDGYPSADVSADGTHPNYRGAALIGKEAARVLPLVKPTWRGSQFRRDHKEYCVNPFLYGAYAHGVRNYEAGYYDGSTTRVTGNGPESVVVGVTGGTFTSLEVSKGSSLNDNSSPLIVTASGASDDWAGVVIRVGSNDLTSTGLSQRCRWDQNWAASTSYTIGAHARLPAYPLGILTCIAVSSGDAGTSAGTTPAPASATGYGEIITDGGVIWMWQKLPSVGDVFFAESEYEITSLTGGVAPRFLMQLYRTPSEYFATHTNPYFDISGVSGIPPTTWPLSGGVRTPEVTLTSPGAGINLRHVFAEWRIHFTLGGGAVITIPRISIRRV